MKTRRKILISLSIAVLVVLILAAGTLLYLYHHPSSFKPFLEKALSGAAGGELKIRAFTYSLSPLYLRAEGISLGPGDRLKGIGIEIPLLEADMALEGPFGRRRLIIRAVRSGDFLIRIARDAGFTGGPAVTERASRLQGILKGLAALLLFRDIAFQEVDLKNGAISASLADREIELAGIEANMDRDRRIAINCRARFRSPSRGLEITAPGLRITTDRVLSLTVPEIRARVAAREIALLSPNLDIPALDWTTDLTYFRDRDLLAFSNLTLGLKGALLRPASSSPWPPLDLSLGADGTLDLRDFGARLSSFHLRAGDILDAEGRLGLDLGAGPEAALDLIACRLLPGKLRPFIPVETLRPFSAVTLSGPVSIRGGVKAGLVDGGLVSNWDIEARLDKNPFSFRPQGLEVDGKITGEINLSGTLPGVKVRARVGMTDTLLSTKDLQTGPLTSNMTLILEGAGMEIGPLEIRSSRAAFEFKGKERSVEDILFRAGKGTWNRDNGKLLLSGATLETSLLKNLEVSFSMDRGGKTILIKGKDTRLLETARVLDLLPPRWRFGAIDEIEARVLQGRDGNWSLGADLNLRGLALADRDGACTGEGIVLGARVEGEMDRDLSSARFRAALDLEGGEVLYDRFYFNLKQNGLAADCEGTYEVPGKTLRLDRLRAGMKNLIDLNLRGIMDRGPDGLRCRFTLKVPETPLEPVFRHFLAEPFGSEKPILSTLDVGGALSGELAVSLQGTSGTVKGLCQWQGGQFLSREKGYGLRDIDLRFPVWYRAGKGEMTGQPLRGGLSVRSVTLPIVPEQPLSLEMTAGPNRISLKTGSPLKVPGGEIELGPLSCDGLYTSNPSVETNLLLQSLDLAPLLSPIWERAIRGTLRGRLAPVRFEKGRLTARGEIRADVFGGRVTLTDFGASGILTSAPVFRLNAGWEDLRLGDITRETAFGRIEGVLKGYLRDLEIAYGQPQRFELLLETVETDDIPQKISVKAIDNIARLGGGTSPFVGFAGVFTSLFKELPYRRIGALASLENDVFRINGTIREEGTEYLIKRGRFSGVNVVIQNSDNRIPFKDMVKRIKPIFTSRGAPVIR